MNRNFSARTGMSNLGVRTLLFSTLYPSSVRPGHGIFVETRQRELMARHPVETRVVAPVPWFPSAYQRFGAYAMFAKTPRHEIHNGLQVWHPRYPLLPKFGMSLAPFSLAIASLPTIRGILRSGFDFDVIDAHYFYPDGVAAAMLARLLDKPLCITARGSDLNLIPKFRIPRRLIEWAACRAGVSIGVCDALLDVLRELRVDERKLRVIRNGVDLARFRPLDPETCRRTLGLTGAPVLLSVGHLVELKGHHLLVEALMRVRQRYTRAHLVIVGDGPYRSQLVQQIEQLGLAGHVTLAGAQPNAELPHWYGAADALVLASSREGWANVLLEAMACGTPVVATRVGGSPEVVQQESGGVLVNQRSVPDLADAILNLLSSPPNRALVRQYAEDFGWGPSSDAQYAVFRQLGKVG